MTPSYVSTDLIAIESVSLRANTLVMQWSDGVESAFHYFWLRDNSPEARTPNGQRLIETHTIPEDVAPQSVELLPTGAVSIIWAHDGLVSVFEPSWLRAYRVPDAPPEDTRKLWDASLTDHLPQASYSDVSTNNAQLRDWLQYVHDYGFAVLHDVPVISGALLDVVSLFGYVRATNYGKWFDVKSVATPNNLAYTGMPLSVHTDNPYRDPVPTLQLLHCLSSEVEGGDSVVVDGFSAAEALRAQSPDDFLVLASHPVRFYFRDEQTELTAESTIIRLNQRGAVSAVRFNNRSLASLTFPAAQVERYYAAYRAYAHLVTSSAFEVRFKMQPGDLFIVDNERVLHGRTSFSSTGTRHLQGCYADRDGLYSRLRVLKRQ